MEKQQKHILNFLFCGLLCLIFLFLSIASLVGSSVLDPKKYFQEHILFQNDNVLFNILALVLLFALLMFLKSLIKKFRLKTVTTVLIVYVTVAGCLWVCLVKSVPMADSGRITSAAAAFAAGNYSVLQSGDSYFRYFPFQLGFAFVCELLFRIFGPNNYVALGIVNVAFLDIAYLALIKLSRLIFENKAVVRITILLLASCLQPILFCTYIYGNIIGFALSMWAVVFLMLYLKTRKKRNLIFAFLLVAVAIVTKPNYYIVLTAMCIILLIDCLRPFKLINIIAVLCAVVLSVGLCKIVIKGYEAKAETDLGSGVPQILWAAMGLQESDMAPGWYNRYTLNTYNKSNLDGEIATNMARSKINERLKYFAANPEYALSFFSKKVLSEWNEASFESIWVSKTKEHLSPVSGSVNAIYNSTFLMSYFNAYQLFIFVGFFIALIIGIKKRDNIFTVIPLIILGGFFYHLIFEAKSQYILVYFVMLIPYAAYGLSFVGEKVKCIYRQMVILHDKSHGGRSFL